MKKVVIVLVLLVALIGYGSYTYYSKLDKLSFGVRETYGGGGDGQRINFNQSTKKTDIVSKWKKLFEDAHWQSQPITLKDKPSEYIMLNSESKGIGYASVEIHYLDDNVYLVDSGREQVWYIKMSKEEFDSLPRP